MMNGETMRDPIELSCPECGGVLYSYSPTSTNHSDPGCAAFNGDWAAFDRMMAAVAKAHGTTIAQLEADALERLCGVECRARVLKNEVSS